MSIKIDLTKDNMDLVMNLVRSELVNPSVAINLLLDDYRKHTDAKSKLYDEKQRKFTYKNP